MTLSKKPKTAKKPEAAKKAVAKTTPRSLAKKFDLDVETVQKELSDLGVEAKTLTTAIDEELLEVVLHHLEEVSRAGKQQAAQKEEADKVGATPPESASATEIHLKSPIVVKQLAEALGKKPNELITRLLKMNVLAAINQTIDTKVAEKICADLGMTLIVDHRHKEEHIQAQHTGKDEEKPEEQVQDNPDDLVERPPVVAFLGHVDHGKTSIQDALRETNVAGGEAGGITQHIGASVITYRDRTITFIDTPGHEAFTAMRARGANATDIAVLVVAADDGFMPQTVEALSHLKAAKVPIIVAINKMDLPAANPDRVLLQMQQNELMSEDWGGNVGVARISAVTKQGLNELLDRILLEAEMLELKANPKRPAEGVVLEAELGQGTGATANVLVRNGTLKIGDPILCGSRAGRVKALIDAYGRRVKEVGPSLPAKVLGLSGVPDAGCAFSARASEKEAIAIAEKRMEEERSQSLTRRQGASLEDLFANFDKGKRNNLRLIIKTDVKGTAEAIIDSLRKLPSDKINVEFIHTGVGAISEADVLLASASTAIIVGFHVKVNPGVNDLASREGVEIRLYSIIYEALEDITDALVGRLAPIKREKDLGKAKILKIFEMSKGPKVCGCVVEQGVARVGAHGRIYRDKELIYNGVIQSLRRFQDDVREVRAGQECGIRMDNFMEFQENDVIAVYDIELEKATL